ncbi:lateral flagellar hook-length control protein LafE [Aeromonas salmonicida]|uniref:lateral flagellar hook-length control protein LafE n=1 Tax=Aeromonas salmonicida TaxID=645 RepID=UPI00259D7F4B|nr:lateral flagellar hook-length control protein LafE [Aeromonas salmonicida]MDM5126818.1 lateral flagellar hook-length control protein LafE [Aeromonas salmonicida]
MGMIQFAGVDSVATLESTGFNRLARQPDEQGEMYQPLDLPFTEELTALPAEVVDDADAGIDVVDTAPEDATELLESFTNMPPVFILNDEVVRLSSARLAQPDAEMNSGQDGGGVHDRSPSISVALRSLSAYGRSETELPHIVEQITLGKDKPAFSVTDFSRMMVGQQAAQTGDLPSRDKLIASLQPLLGDGGSFELDSGVPEFKGGMGNLLSLPLSRPSEYQWAPAKLADNPAHWGQQLVDVLKDKVEIQVNQQIKQAHIRLDPPELGRLELTVRVDGDRLNVQLNVTNPAVRDALIQSMERLRMSLAPHHAGGVEVNVGQGGEQAQQEKWQQQQIMAGRRQWQEDIEPTDSTMRDWLNTLV